MDIWAQVTAVMLLRVRQDPAELYICPRSGGQRWDLVLVFMSHNLEKVTSLSFIFPSLGYQLELGKA